LEHPAVIAASIKSKTSHMQNVRVRIWRCGDLTLIMVDVHILRRIERALRYRAMSDSRPARVERTSGYVPSRGTR